MRLLALTIAILAMLSAGCASIRPEDAKGYKEAGPVSSVDVAGGRGGNAVMPDVRRLPITDWARPDIPLVYGPEVISVWIYPRPSRDGFIYREGVWAHMILKTFSWGMEQAKRESLPLNQAGDMSGRPLSVPVSDRSSTFTLPKSFEDGWKDFGSRRSQPAVNPWTQAPSASDKAGK